MIKSVTCPVCDESWDRNDPNQPWKEHENLPIGGLNLNGGGVFLRAHSSINEKYPDGIIICSNILLTPDEEHRRNYGHLDFIFSREHPEELNLTTPLTWETFYSQGRPTIKELSPEEYSRIVPILKANSTLSGINLTRGILTIL